jgi:hypothetical protein
MNARGTEEVESQCGLRKETIPFSERELGIDSAEDSNKVIFKSANGTFGGIDTVFFRRNTLELDVVFGKRVLEILRTFVVKDV